MAITSAITVMFFPGLRFTVMRGTLDPENVGGLDIQPRAIDVAFAVPLFEDHHDFDALLLTHGVDAEDGGDIEQTNRRESP